MARLCARREGLRRLCREAEVGGRGRKHGRYSEFYDIRLRIVGIFTDYVPSSQGKIKIHVDFAREKS